MHITRVLAPLALAALAGCVSLSRNAPDVQQYVLGGARTPLAAAADSGGLSIGIRRMDLAPYLTTPSLVVRRGDHRIEASPFHRWGEDLGEGINHTVAAHLANRAPVRHVNIAPWAARTHHDYLVQLHVTRFEGVADSAATTAGVHVVTAWDIIRPLDGALLVRGTTDYRDGRFPLGDYDAMVAALNVALQRVAEDLRGCLAQFRTDSLPPRACD
jgi:uncharacterized protein